MLNLRSSDKNQLSWLMFLLTQISAFYTCHWQKNNFFAQLGLLTIKTFFSYTHCKQGLVKWRRSMATCHCGNFTLGPAEASLFVCFTMSDGENISGTSGGCVMPEWDDKFSPILNWQTRHGQTFTVVSDDELSGALVVWRNQRWPAWR